MADVKYASPKKPRRAQPAEAPAAPTSTGIFAVQESERATPADSMRDRLAAMALASAEVSAQDDDGRYWFTPEQIAKRCYAVADAMLREREAGDDVDIYEAAMRDDRVRLAHAARVDTTVKLALIAVRSRQHPEWGRNLKAPAAAAAPVAPPPKSKRARSA
jgi:hypothetical protein